MPECSATTHTKCDPDHCFSAKMTYWREEPGAGMSFSFAGGRQTFHDTGSIKQQERDALADARRGGMEPERYNASTAHTPTPKKNRLVL